MLEERYSWSLRMRRKRARMTVGMRKVVMKTVAKRKGREVEKKKRARETGARRMRKTWKEMRMRTKVLSATCPILKPKMPAKKASALSEVSNAKLSGSAGPSRRRERSTSRTSSCSSPSASCDGPATITDFASKTDKLVFIGFEREDVTTAAATSGPSGLVVSYGDDGSVFLAGVTSLAAKDMVFA